MSASLVGSEMCIRDRIKHSSPVSVPTQADRERLQEAASRHVKLERETRRLELETETRRQI
eukprot:617979-Alexandrium_andersonii.AAC.1